MTLCSGEQADGCIALHTLTTIWYILRKADDVQRRQALRSLCELLEVVGTTHDEVVAAINQDDFKDFEDCVQSKCAKTAKADYIVTRNAGDFTFSEVPVLSPHELTERLR